MYTHEDLYEILEVNSKCTVDELKAAYRVKLLRYHPDKILIKEPKDDGILETGEIFKTNDSILSNYHKIMFAWEILSNQESRKQYDMKRLLDGANGMISKVHYNPGDIGDVVLLSTLEKNNVGFFHYPCRCGGNYEIHLEDIDNNNDDGDDYIAIPCDGCSLYITIDIRN